MTKKILAAAAILFAAMATPAAAAIIYDVNQELVSGSYEASVTGYVETNGILGTLNAGDILGWNLNLSADHGLYTSNDNTANSGVYLTGNDVTATAQHLYFNFGGSGGEFFFEQIYSSGSNYWCNSQGGACLPGETVATLVYTPPTGVTVPGSGNAIIATAVPEPATWAMLLVGFGGIGFMMRRPLSRVAIPFA